MIATNDPVELARYECDRLTRNAGRLDSFGQPLESDRMRTDPTIPVTWGRDVPLGSWRLAFPGQAAMEIEAEENRS